MKKKHHNKVRSAEAPPAAGKTQSTGFTAQVWVFIALIAVATVIAYIPLFDAEKQFTNYDDNGYVTAQPLVLDFKLTEMFQTTSSVGLNYHPLTVLSLAATKAMFGLDARAFAVTNLLLHVINALLVFGFIRLLVPHRPVVAMLTGLWFGIHPMHVESVAWIAERKDSLYVLFMLVSLIAYIRHVQRGGYAYLVVSFLSFVASCLSKAMVVPLPFVFLLLDYWYDRSWSVRSILEKLPFVAFAIWIGMLTVSIQTSLGAVSSYRSMADRLVFAAYGFMSYWVKMIAPYDLSAFHPYPGSSGDAPIPAHFYLAPLFVAGMLAVPLLLREHREWFRTWIFSVGFFTLMILLVLQIVSVGMVLMADRYTYASYIGSLFLLSTAAAELLRTRIRPVAMGLIVAFSVMQIWMTFDYSKTWKSTETLWAHVLGQGSKDPDPVTAIVDNIKNGYTPVYVFRATHYMETQQYEKAYNDLSFLFHGDCVNPGPYEQMGLVCGILGKYRESADMFSKAIAMHPVSANIYFNRAISYVNLGRRAEAYADFETSVKEGITGQDFLQANGYIMETLLKEQKYSECLERARQVQSVNPNHHESYFFEGTALINLGRNAEAVKALKKSLAINPNQPGATKNLELAMKRVAQ